MEISTQYPISITPSAIKELNKLLEAEQSNDRKIIRIGVDGGGCAGFTYILKFDSTITEADTIYEIEQLKIVINKAHEIYLQGTEIDFKSGLDNRGFIYNNPNANNTCGCGTSFSV